MSLIARARRVLPGGVNSPVRAFRGVGGDPVFVRAADGAWLEAENGRRYIDYIGSYGPLIFGHRPPEVTEAIITMIEEWCKDALPYERMGEWIERIGWPAFFERCGIEFTKQHIDDFKHAGLSYKRNAHLRRASYMDDDDDEE